MFQREIKNSCFVNKSKVVNSSFDKDSEFIDITQDDNSVINEKEEKKEINAYNVSLGKKRKRKKEKYNRNIQKNKKKKIIKDNDNNNEDKSDKSLLSNKNNIILNNNNNDNKIEKEKLLNLVKEEGFNTIFSLISNSNFDQNNPIEKELEEIINRIGLLRVTLFLIQIKFSSSSEENKILKKRKEIENDIKNLGEHLHKEKDGKIYRYFKHYIRLRGYVFHCFDRSCKSTGLYNLENMNFKILTPHTIPYDQHIYISNKEKYEQYKDILEDFKKRDCTEAQVFKNANGDKLVKWYNN